MDVQSVLSLHTCVAQLHRANVSVLSSLFWSGISVVKKRQQIMKILSFMAEVHHLFKSTLTKWNPMNGSLKDVILFVEKS